MLQFFVVVLILVYVLIYFLKLIFSPPKVDPASKLEEAHHKIGRLEHECGLAEDLFRKEQEAHKALQEQFEKLRFSKISGDVKLGQKTEQLAGLLENFPAPLHTLKFLGAPIDYVSIDLEKELIIFIEVKTGQSRLSDTQKKIRKIIKDKNIEFREFRI